MVDILQSRKERLIRERTGETDKGRHIDQQEQRLGFQ